jgi:hypothetical protein
LFVVGNLALSAGDDAVGKRLQGLGYELRVVDGPNAFSADTTNATLIVISKTVEVDDVRSTFRNVQKPVLLWEPLLYDDMGMVPATPDSTRGTVNAGRSIQILDAASELSGGLRGSIQVLGPSTDQNGPPLTFGTPNSRAISIAAIPGQPEKMAIFGYDTGVAMPGLSAPARRLGMFLADNTASLATNDGWTLFDAGVRWADPQ